MKISPSVKASALSAITLSLLVGCVDQGGATASRFGGPFNGLWSGYVGFETGAFVPMSADFGENPVYVDYKKTGCRGTWKRTGKDGNITHYVETIEEGSCKSGDVIAVVMDGNDMLFNAFKPNETLVRSAGILNSGDNPSPTKEKARKWALTSLDEALKQRAERSSGAGIGLGPGEIFAAAILGYAYGGGIYNALKSGNVSSESTDAAEEVEPKQHTSGTVVAAAHNTGCGSIGCGGVSSISFNGDIDSFPSWRIACQSGSKIVKRKSNMWTDSSGYSFSDKYWGLSIEDFAERMCAKH